jgi:hypothetical protein
MRLEVVRQYLGCTWHHLRKQRDSKNILSKFGPWFPGNSSSIKIDPLYPDTQRKIHVISLISLSEQWLPRVEVKGKSRSNGPNAPRGRMDKSRTYCTALEQKLLTMLYYILDIY